MTPAASSMRLVAIWSLPPEAPPATRTRPGLAFAAATISCNVLNGLFAGVSKISSVWMKLAIGVTLSMTDGVP